MKGLVTAHPGMMVIVRILISRDCSSSKKFLIGVMIVGQMINFCLTKSFHITPKYLWRYLVSLSQWRWGNIWKHRDKVWFHRGCCSTYPAWFPQDSPERWLVTNWCSLLLIWTNSSSDFLELAMTCNLTWSPFPWMSQNIRQVHGLQATVFLDELTEWHIHMELVWVWVLPNDLYLVDCLAMDLVVWILVWVQSLLSFMAHHCQ